MVVTDTDFIELDFNACGTSAGNPGPSYLSGIHRCQKTTGVRLLSLSVCGLSGLSFASALLLRFPWYVSVASGGAAVAWVVVLAICVLVSE